MDKLKETGAQLISGGAALTLAVLGHLATRLDNIGQAAEAGNWDELGIIVVGHVVFAGIGLAVIVAGMVYRIKVKQIETNRQSPPSPARSSAT